MSSDQLSDDEEQRLWQHKHFGMNVVKTPPVDQSIAQMPANFAHLAMGPVEQMVRMPDLPNGEALWISRDALRYCVIMSDQTWVARLHSAAPRLQGILQDTASINWWNVYFETDSERSAASASTGAAVPAAPTVQGHQASSVRQATDQQLPVSGTRSNSMRQASQSQLPLIAQDQQRPTISGRAPAQGGFDTQNGAGFLVNGSSQDTSSTAQVPSAGPQGGIFYGGYGNVIPGPPAKFQHGAPQRAGQDLYMHGTIVDGGRGVAGGVQRPTLVGAPNGFPARPFASYAPLQQPPALFPSNVNVGSNAGEEGTTQDTTPRRGSNQSRGSTSTSRGVSRGSSAGGRRARSVTRGGLTRRQEFNMRRMAELANGTAIQTAPPVQELLERNAPLVQNGPIPNPLALAAGLRQEFGGSDLSRSGPFFTRNAATQAGAAGSNVVQAGNAVQAGNVNQGGSIPGSYAVDGANAEDSEDAGDQAEAVEDAEEELEDISDNALEED